MNFIKRLFHICSYSNEFIKLNENEHGSIYYFKCKCGNGLKAYFDNTGKCFSTKKIK